MLSYDFMIQEYKFGWIKIDNKEYDYDVLVRKGEVLKWWREEGHEVCEKDLDKALVIQPKFIIIGTGASGMMEMPGTIRSFVESKGINLMVDQTKEASLEYNRLEQQGQRVVALLHLTC